jgi:hypothetical protein
MSGILSFIGGTAFRWLFGEILGFFKAKQEHKQELEMLRLSQEHEAQRAQWRKDEIAAQAAAGVQVIEAKAEADDRGFANSMTLEALRQIGQKSGIAWVDAWNQSIRPLLATVAIILIVGNAIAPAHVVLSGVVLEVVCGILGLFVGGRIHATGR